MCVAFCGSLQGGEGLKLDLKTMIKYFDRGGVTLGKVPHITVPLRRRSKGEQREHCHLIPLTNTTASGIPICMILSLLV